MSNADTHSACVCRGGGGGGGGGWWWVWGFGVVVVVGGGGVGGGVVGGGVVEETIKPHRQPYVTSMLPFLTVQPNECSSCLLCLAHSN